MTDVPAAWHPDPYRRHELRYWDGTQWTEHVTTRGQQGRDSIAVAAPATRQAKAVQREVRRAGAVDAGASGGGTILTEPILVVNQKAKLIEVNAEYAIFDQHGNPLGAVREVGQAMLKKVVRPDRFTSRRLQVVDASGRVVLTITQPVAIVKERVSVRLPDGELLGELVQKWISILGKESFSLEIGGETIGSLNAEDRDSWDFNIQDAAGNEIARVTKSPVGLAKDLFSKNDNYVVTVSPRLDGPLRAFAIGAALSIDTVLHQGSASGRRR